MSNILKPFVSDQALPAGEMLRLYEMLIRPRMIEQKMLSLLRQGKISKWFSGIGQEAISVGSTAALRDEEYIFTLHRNLGVFTTRNVPLSRLFAQWQGSPRGFTKGRDRSFHFGAPEHGIIGMISHLGPQLSLADGVALAYKLRGEEKVTLAFTGEGGTSEGEFHEALNLAAVWKLPVIFLIENNAYGLSTPTSEQYACLQLSDRGAGYGMESLTIDGNDLLGVYGTVRKYAESIRSDPRPVLIECMTFRMRGHEEASGTKYVPEELLQEWNQRDPVHHFENHLLEAGILDQEKIQILKSQIGDEIKQAVENVFSAPDQILPGNEMSEIYRPVTNEALLPDTSHVTELRFVDAISQGLQMAMEKHPDLILMGQDIAEYGGVFKVTEGFISKFGRDRVRNTPLCESAVIGAAMGLSLQGFKAMVEMQFADFVSCGFNQIINNLAKVYYRWEGWADVVIRMPTGAGTGAGPFHSQSNEAWFYHTPGLKIVYPSSPADAKGLLTSSISDPNPVLFFEHKMLYRSISEPVPVDYYETPLGVAKLVSEGTRASIITYGMGVHWAREAREHNNWDIDVLDLRTLVPMDYDAISSTVRKTGKVLILHEDTLTGGIGADISAFISEHLFEFLDAPIIRVASLDTPVPFAKSLEDDFLASARLKEKMNKLLTY